MPNQKRDQFTAQARSEAAADSAAEEARLLTLVREGPFAAEVNAFFVETTECERLEAARDAEIAAINAKYEVLMPNPGQHIRAYNEGRGRLLLERVADAGLEICYKCTTAKPDVELVLLDGHDIFGHTDCMSTVEWWAKYDRLERLCANCQSSSYKQAQAERAEGKTQLTYCNVWPAEERPDGTWVQYERGWAKAPELVERFTRDYSGGRNISERLAVEWDIPPELRVFGDEIFIRRAWDDDLPVAAPSVTG